MNKAGSQQEITKRNLVSPGFLLLGSLSAFAAAYLLINGSYLTLFGYRPAEDNIPVSGMETWGLGYLFTLITLCLFLSAVFCIFWQRKFGRLITWWQAILGFMILILGLVTFYPSPFNLQLRYYDGPAYSSYIFLAQNSEDAVDGNDTRFAGSIEKEGLDVYYNEKENPYQSKKFICKSSRAWWWGKLTVLHNFHPTLDEKNQQELLKKYCKPITEEEAAAKGLDI